MNEVSDWEQEIYQAWLKNHKKFKATAHEMDRNPEYIRQVVARVETKLRKKERSDLEG